MSVFRLTIETLVFVIRNFGAALRLSVIPVLVLCLVPVAGAYLVNGSWNFSFQYDFDDPRRGHSAFRTGTGSLIVMSVRTLPDCLAWLAVAWHRFVLLNENVSSFVPGFQTKRIAGYVWRFWRWPC